MILLADIISQCSANTYYSRSDADLIAAVNRAGQLLFQRMFAREVVPVSSQWTPITVVTGGATVNLPDSLAPALASFATADLLAQNNDDGAAGYVTIAEQQWAAAWLQLRAQRPLTTEQAGPLGILLGRVKAKLATPRSLDELLSAIDGAGQYIFQAITRENRAYFTRTTLDLALQPGQQTYLLPPDCGQIAYIGEQPVGSAASVSWAEILPESQAASVALANLPLAGTYFLPYYSGGLRSAFSYFGPYLSADQTVAPAQQQSINISPAIDTARTVLLVYIARWSPVTTPGSPITLPVDALATLESYTMARLLRTEPDPASRSLSPVYQQEGDLSLRLLLSTVRQRRVPGNLRVPLFGGE